MNTTMPDIAKFVRENFNLDTPAEIEVVTVSNDVEYHNAMQGAGNTIKIPYEKVVSLVETGKVRLVDFAVNKLIVAYAIGRFHDRLHGVANWMHSGNQSFATLGKLIYGILSIYSNIPIKSIGFLPWHKALNMRNHIDGLRREIFKNILDVVGSPYTHESIDFSAVNNAINHAQHLYSKALENIQENLGLALTISLREQMQNAIEVQMKKRGDQANQLLAEISEAKKNATNQLADMELAYASFRKEITANRVKSKELLESIEKITSESGVSAQANFFAAQVKHHETFSFCWLWGTIVAAGLLIFWIGGSGFLESILPASGLTWWTRALIALVLTSLLAYSVKNYMAHKHNAVVNKHRENALRTYKALVESAPSQETKEIVLHHAAACIYAPQDSGYVKDSGKTQPASMPVAIRSAPMSKIAGRDEN